MNKPNSLKVQWLDPSTLIPYAKNNKLHPQEQIDRMAAGIETFGFDQPIVVDKDMVIIKGHGRRLAGIKLGVKVPVVVRDDLSKEQADAARISDNVVTSTQYDTRAMQEELVRIFKDNDFGMTAESIGLSAKETDLLLGEIETPDLSALMDDTTSEVEEQKKADAKRVEEADGNELKLSKVLGFSSVTGAEARTLTRFMAHVEAETGLEGKEALVSFAGALAA